LSSSSTPILAKVRIPRKFDFLWTPSRYKAAHGGRGGAKSHSMGQALVVQASQAPLRILCCREIQKSIKDSVKRLLDDKIKAAGLRGFYHSTDTEIRGANDSLFIFAGLRSNIDSIKSMEGIDRVWVEEAHSVSKDSLNMLIPTIRKPNSELWFSWNPRFATDPVDEMFRGQHLPPDALVREISWRDNPWFPDVLRQEMEWDRRRDIEKYSHIWGGGYRKNSAAQVFTNWRVGEESEFQPAPDTVFRLGGDWGFSQDPSVLIRCYIVGRTLFVDHEAWALGCDIDRTPFLFGGCADEDLQKKNEQAWRNWKGPKFPGVPEARKWRLVADSARPETISYMQQHGFPLIVGAKKGPGSVEEGVEFLKSYDIVVHPRCVHVISELTGYSWKVDKLTGLVLPILEDAKNHTIDSLRYAVENVRRAVVKWEFA
jgi:phage terminase large subunit